MKLDTRAFSISVGVTSASLYLLCALVVSAIPEFAAALGRHTLHVDMSEQISSITFLDTVTGTICWLVGMTGIAALVAWLYNRLLPKEALNAG